MEPMGIKPHMKAVADTETLILYNLQALKIKALKSYSPQR